MRLVLYINEDYSDDGPQYYIRGVFTSHEKFMQWINNQRAITFHGYAEIHKKMDEDMCYDFENGHFVAEIESDTVSENELEDYQCIATTVIKYIEENKEKIWRPSEKEWQDYKESYQAYLEQRQKEIEEAKEKIELEEFNRLKLKYGDK
jgi:soluble cytochrome b562